MTAYTHTHSAALIRVENMAKKLNAKPALAINRVWSKGMARGVFDIEAKRCQWLLLDEYGWGVAVRGPERATAARYVIDHRVFRIAIDPGTAAKAYVGMVDHLEGREGGWIYNTHGDNDFAVCQGYYSLGEILVHDGTLRRVGHGMVGFEVDPETLEPVS